MSVAAAIEQARKTAAQLEASGSGNEANTRALLIEPLLASLGWNLTDLDVVDREYRVYDGTALDYALKIAGHPRLFVEAKGITKSLDDKQFIAQTVNYANNEGVVWCVLTNGLRFRIYKTNEPVGMADKLLFEVDLAEEANGAGRAGDLELISRKAVEEGRLDDWGERVFTDSRVRVALAELASSTPSVLTSALDSKLGQPKIAQDRLQDSLVRILAGGTAPASSPGKGAKQSPAHPQPKAKGGKSDGYGLDHHTASKPAAVVDLFQQVDDFVLGLGGDVTRRIRKFYVGYFAGAKERSFVTAEVQKQKIWIYLATPPNQAAPWNDEFMRDVREVGHYGMGDTEYVLRTADQLAELKGLIRQAYELIH